jgi:hypothetical protein
MKTANFLILFVAVLFTFSSCSSDQNAQNISSSVSDNQKETRGVAGTKNFGSRFTSTDNTYIVLKLDNTFEASFEQDVVIKGKWVKENEGKKLKLSSEKSGDGKGKAFLKEFTVIEHSDVVLRLMDSEGKRIEMSSEE